MSVDDEHPPFAAHDVQERLLGRSRPYLGRRVLVPAHPFLFDRLVPVLRRLDRVPLPFGLPVRAVAEKEAR